MNDRSRAQVNLGLPLSLSLIVGLLLTALPVFDLIYYLWPEWVLLIVVYWSIHHADRVGPVVAMLVGLLLDVLAVSTLGVSSLALALVAQLANSVHRQVLALSLWQQMLVVGCANFGFTSS